MLAYINNKLSETRFLSPQIDSKIADTFFMLVQDVSTQARREGVRRVRTHPPTGSRGPFFVDQRLKQSEFRLLFYSNSLIVYCSKIENTVKELISLSHPFNKTCFSLRKLYIKKGIWYTYKKLTPF